METTVYWDDIGKREKMATTIWALGLSVKDSGLRGLRYRN